jgi:PQQ-dependent dehydrogenase (s-GDH family)
MGLRVGRVSGWRLRATLAMFVIGAVALGAQGPAGITRGTDRFASRVVVSGLASPWEVAWGPDGHLWITEREGQRVVRVNPVDGSRDTLLELPDVYRSVLQDGLLGLALHADFGRGRGADYLYLSFTYDEDAGAGASPRLAVRRYRYDTSARRLVEPSPVLTGLPAHDDHVGGRLVFGPDRMLYLAIGDQGSNFGRNRCRVNRAQELPTAEAVRRRDWSAYAGKILRIALDGSIPADNPLLDGVRSHVFSYVHRNPLGLVFGPAGLYESEHGPETDDEVNLIEAGRNYGWPHVAGFQDDKVYAYANWSASAPEPCAALPGRGGPPPSVPTTAERAWSHPRFAAPLRTFFTFDTAAGVQQAGGGTIAPGGLDMHSGQGGGVPGWNTSLLVLSLLKGVAYRVPLSADGRSVAGQPVEVFKSTNRLRDIAVHPGQRRFYVATDPVGRTADDNGAPTQALANPGSVLEFVYLE